MISRAEYSSEHQTDNMACPITASELDAMPRFHSNPVTLGPVESINLSAYSAVDNTGLFNFVITGNNELIVGPRDATHVSSSDAQSETWQLHPYLARNADVLTAGTIHKRNGQWVADNSSGHYRPQGPHQESLVRWHLSEK